MRSLWLAKKGERSVALQIVPDKKHKRVEFEIIQKKNGKWISQANPKPEIKNPQFDGTVKRGSATCPCCGYTTPVARVRVQLKERHGGANDARLFCVVTTKETEQGRFYRLPTQRDLDAVKRAAQELERRKKAHKGKLSLVPDEPLPPQGALGFRVPLYGMNMWGDLFTSRQSLSLTTLVSLIQKFGDEIHNQTSSANSTVIQTSLALALDRQADYLTSLTVWASTGEFIAHTFGRQALPIVWEWPECQLFADGSGNWVGAIEWIALTIENMAANISGDGQSQQSSATSHPLPDDATQIFFTDPPYYDAVPYSDLSDFFYVWLRRTLPQSLAAPFINRLTPKDDECIVDEMKGKDREYFERMMGQAMAEGRRILNSNGVGVVVFAHKSTAGWEAQLQAMIDAGWTMTGSWPIDTERPGRLRAHDSAALASSVHLVCRPRENEDGSRKENAIGDWRDVLSELPKRINEWMPRLAQEGVVGADAIFACLGPALEIFSRYERVEKADGTQITLREYLEYVWAAVGREALNQIFAGADTSGFEEDARLTALWLWTLNANSGDRSQETEEDADDEDEEGEGKATSKAQGFALEYDTARKLAQGIGAHLEDLGKGSGVVEVKGDKARLLSVTERRAALFGRGKTQTPEPANKKKGRGKQMALEIVEETVGAVTPADEEGEFTIGNTMLDRVHQSMLLFGDGRSEALKRFLVDDGAGKDNRFWRLAQTLSALYPTSSQEKRWVDGVLARKKGLGV
jgi:adenine-specific DNA methylase